MRAQLFLLLVVPIGALFYKYNGEATGESCSDPSKMTQQTFPGMEHRFKNEAKTPELLWKMKKAVTTLTDADIANCGSCDGIAEAKKNVARHGTGGEYKLKKIFYINPEGVKGRHNHITRVLNETASQYEVEWWKASTAKDATPTAIKEFTKKGVELYVQRLAKSRATIAVYLSHARLLKHIHETAENGEDVYAIFEDDAQPNKNWVARALGLLKYHVPEDWDIFKFGYFKPSSSTQAVSPCVQKSRGMQFGMQAYFVRPKSIPAILGQLHNLPVYDVDGALGGMFKQLKHVNAATGKEEFTSRGLVLYTSISPFVGQPVGGSLRMNDRRPEEAHLNAQEEEEELDDGPSEEELKAKEDAWPAFEKAWDNQVEDDRTHLGLHAMIVGEDGEGVDL